MTQALAAQSWAWQCDVIQAQSLLIVQGGCTIYLTTLCMCRVLNVNAGHNRHVVVALSCQARTLIKSASVDYMRLNSKPSLPNCLAEQTFYEQINWHKRLALWKPLVVEEAYLYCSYITKKNSHDTMATLLRHAGAISSGTYISDNHHGVAVLRCACCCHADSLQMV